MNNKIQYEKPDDNYQYLQRWLNWEAFMMMVNGEIK
jgi:hypothetical protein